MDVRGRRASRLPHLSDAFHAVVELLSSVLVGDVLAGVIPTLLPLGPSLTLRTHGGGEGPASAIRAVGSPERRTTLHLVGVTADFLPRWRQKRAEVFCCTRRLSRPLTQLASAAASGKSVVCSRLTHTRTRASTLRSMIHDMPSSPGAPLRSPGDNPTKVASEDSPLVRVRPTPPAANSPTLRIGHHSEARLRRTPSRP